MILFIDTTEKNKIFIALIKENKLKSKLELNGKFHQSERLLPSINKLLKINKIMPADLSGIIVVAGPGAFTSVRIGVITANALSFALNIPVVGVQKLDKITLKNLIAEGLDKLEKARLGRIVLPFYGKEPNITKSKKKHKV